MLYSVTRFASWSARTPPRASVLRRRLGLLGIEAGEIDQGMGHVGETSTEVTVTMPTRGSRSPGKADRTARAGSDRRFLRAPLASLHSDLATSCTSNTSSWSPSLMSEKFFSDRRTRNRP